ncbi:hypothetical protein HPB52_015596 [Rhipicephalus sanguineus]|uniref:BEN domain-containing protein n=1 Tax=Rhipicephalus sanguineus TaxID=34632 RepID=A0A9D4PWP5_RHISA|nr:hypothetical protein HPB52_015596 [Rhipicephalus sanguineus]
MSYILVKWVTVDAWDVYPLRNLVDAEAGRRLIESQAFVDCMAGRVYQVQSSPDVEPDDAFIIGIGSQKAMEKRRNAIPVNVGILVVDIGNGVTVPEVMLQKWKAMCPTAPRFARALLRFLFSAEELRGSSLYGRPCNARPGQAPKRALDKNKVDAGIGYGGSPHELTRHWWVNTPMTNPGVRGCDYDDLCNAETISIN